MSSKKRRKADAKSGEADARSGEADARNGEEEVEDESEPVQGGLRGYMGEVESGRHRVIEMRLAIVCGLGVGARVLFSGDLRDDTLANTTIAFLAICILVTILSTWLGYFPQRLVDVETRNAKGQGIALACILPGMVCSAIVYSALYTAPPIIGLLSLYLCLLCVLAFCSILATLLHVVPYPNSITLYNFALIGVSLAVQRWLNVPFWVVLAAVVLYSAGVPWLLHCFPASFTLGEAMLVAQGLTLVFTDTALQLVTMYDLIALPKEWKILRSEALLYVEFLWSGVFLCCLLLSPALYKVNAARYHHERKFWSGSFILLSLSVGLMLVLPWVATLLGGQNAIAFIFIFSVTRHVRLVLVVYWVMVSFAAGVLVAAQTSDSEWLSPFKANRPSSFWLRKWFHLLALLVYLPGAALDPPFMALASAIVSFLFLVAELVRYFRLWPAGDLLRGALHPMLDGRDSGPIVLTHLYLLLGFSLPLWLFPHRHYTEASKLAVYAGVLALGVGDSVAAVAGKLMGKTKWPGTSKTVEGSLMSVLTQLLATLLITLLDPDISLPSLLQWGVVLCSLVATAAMEAYTWQIDNLILSLFQFAFLLAFL